MYTVYVLKSLKTGRKYIGQTAKSPETRTEEHNSGKVPWTRSHRPLKLIYSETMRTLDLAHTRERFFKSGKGRFVLDSILRDIQGR
jgi:predicted GIY-YIG superfamily endonuclease